MNLKKVIELTKDANALLCDLDKEALYKYASQVEEGGIIVDIGTASGASAFIMALASKSKVKVYTIDPVLNDKFLLKRRELKLLSKVFFINDMSANAFKEWTKPIDMLFIDGVHSYEGVKNDFETFGSQVKKGGIIAFHDVLLYGNTVGVCVKELLERKIIKELKLVKGYFGNNPNLVGLLIGEKL